MNLYVRSHNCVYNSREQPQEELSPSQGSLGDETMVPRSGLGLPDASLSRTSALCHFTVY